MDIQGTKDLPWHVSGGHVVRNTWQVILIVVKQSCWCCLAGRLLVGPYLYASSACTQSLSLARKGWTTQYGAYYLIMVMVAICAFWFCVVKTANLGAKFLVVGPSQSCESALLLLSSIYPFICCLITFLYWRPNYVLDTDRALYNVFFFLLTYFPCYKEVTATTKRGYSVQIYVGLFLAYVLDVCYRIYLVF